jgi:hypothetical protein
MDAQLGKVPFVSVSIPSLLRDSSKVSMFISAVSGACSAVSLPGCSTAQPIASKIQNALNTFFSTMSEAAPTLLKVVGMLAPGSVTATVPAPGSVTSGGPGFRVGTVVTTLLPGGGAPTPGASAIVPGTIYAPSSKFPGMFRVAVPRTAAGLGGLGVMEDGAFGTCIFGDCGLGVTAPLVEKPSVSTPLPEPAKLTTEKDLEKQTGTTPFYKKPLFWVAMAGGVVVVGGGSYWMIRRRKRSA